MNRFDRIAQGLLRPVNPYGSIIMGMFTALWGIWLLLPHSVFDTSTVFSKMAIFAPEWAWGSWALICGVLIIYAVEREHYTIHYRSMLFACWHWSTVAGMAWWATWSNPDGLTYSFIALYALYVYLNVKVNHVYNRR